VEWNPDSLTIQLIAHRCTVSSILAPLHT
jgi:hypothetical protein